MQSHRRSRGKIFFEAFCALCVGVSFVGAWIQTGAWAFLGPAFVFTLFGLYWSFDMFGRGAAAVSVQPAFAAETVALAEPEPASEIHFERFEAPAIQPEPAAFVAEPLPDLGVVPFESAAEAVAEPKAKPKKGRSKKAASPAVEAEPLAFVDEGHVEPHIEPLFDPQPFVRQARPAFGKRPRGPGPSPLPAG